MERIILTDLQTSEYEHRFDKKALTALESTPGLPSLLKTVRKYSFDKIQKISHTGSYIKVGENQYPNIYHIFKETCEILDFKTMPKLYLSQMYEINAYATCYCDPLIVLGTGCLEVLNENELRYIIGHELGHVKSQHLLYHDLASIIGQLGIILGDMTMGIGTIFSTGLEIALKYWSRMSEFTSDRAGLLACQSFEAALTTTAKMAGVSRNMQEQLNIDAFLEQAREFEGFDYDTLDKVAKIYSVMGASHPWTVMRASELDKWVASGEYERILRREAKNNKLTPA